MTLCGWKIFSKGKRKAKPETILSHSRVGNDQQTWQPEVRVDNLAQIHKKDFPKEFTVTRSASPQSVYGSDEEGNPRNKCALKPGHSLMDWIRLGSSGFDLSGTKGSIIPISNAELAKHCTQEDAWLAIRGKVYNVTHYMEFHPGGSGELMKGVGSDATKLFNDVHAWVNYEQLLSKCFIGPLRNTAIIDLESSKPLHKASSDNSGSFKAPLIPFLQTTSAKTSPVKSVLNNIDNFSNLRKDGEEPEIVPRFDWIQKTSDLILIFYTRALCNLGLVINYNNDNELDIRIQIENITHLFSFKLLHDVYWPCIVKVSYETGKMELRFTKSKPQLWTSYGTMERQKLIELDSLRFEFEVYEINKITHDSYAISLKPLRRTYIYNPIGYHISLTSVVENCEVTRSYTPVPRQYLPMDVPDFNIPLLVKSYENGILSKHITRLVNSQVQISQPKGNFMLNKLNNHLKIGLLAAGSGITPILAVMDHLLSRISNRIEIIQLLLFNKTENDIWCRDVLEEIANKDNRLILRHILSEAQDNWNGEIGRVSKEIIRTLKEGKSNLSVTYCCVCGPTAFNDLSGNLLKEIGFQSSDLHFFQG